MCWFILVGLAFLLCLRVDGNHFRGGTISWKATGNGNEVQFSFKLGWAYNRGPGCTTDKIGQLVTKMNTSYWQCTSGCNSSINIANVNYICTGASQSEDWEQGERTFTYTFPGIGPYTVEFTGSAWVQLSFGSPGAWSISTIVYLAKRNDTQQPNTSPITTGKPVYRVQYGCRNEILLPVVDADGDDVKCRWSNGSECGSICNALPSATIDENTCTITFPATHSSNGTFAVAVTVQDFTKSNIAIGGQIHLSSRPLSTVVLQFLVKTPPLTVNCNDKPRFVSPTLNQSSVIQTDILKVVNISFYAFGSRRIIGIDVTTPAGMIYSSLQNDLSRSGTVFVKASWTPQQNQVGSHIACALAEDVLGKTSDSRCIEIIVKDVTPCLSSPCGHGGTCVRRGTRQNYMCTCRQGYTGNLCQTDINECASGPCQNHGTCRDQVNGFTCLCVSGYTGRSCETDIDECASSPCENNGTCSDAVNQFNCACASGFTDRKCQIDIDECASHPCQNQGSCIDGINQFTCLCPPGFTGVMCETDINECAINPCKNFGTCIDSINAYRCNCIAGYTGKQCQTDINECDEDPCSGLYDCQDLLNRYSCKLNVGKLMAVIVTTALITIGSGFLIYILKRKYKDVVLSWLSEYMKKLKQLDCHPKNVLSEYMKKLKQLDCHPKNVIRPQAPQ